MESRTELEQLSDEFALWLLLCKLEEAKFETQRLKLQKLVYLLDIFGTLLNRKPTTYTFHVYKYGPYTKEIQCDVEHLVANGLVKATEVEIWSPNQEERSFKYKIVKDSQKFDSELIQLLDYRHVEEAIDFVIQVAGCLSSTDIKSLVYAEPIFIQAKTLVKDGKKEFASPIDDFKFLNRFRELATEICLRQRKSVPSNKEISWYYLNFIQSLEAQVKESSGDNDDSR
jgi:uncharacterized protein YwgA